MVKQRKGKDASPSSPVKTDEDTIKERRVLESYKTADVYTTVLSWALWGAAAAWFLMYTSEAPAMGEWHILCEPSVNLLLAGILCGNLAGIKPSGAWSWWRRPFHLAWGVAWTVMSLSFLNLRGVEVARYPYHLAVALFALAVGQFFTTPSGSVAGQRVSGAYFGRMVLMMDGAIGLLLCLCTFSDGASFHPQAAKIGWTGIACSVSGLGLLSVGTGLCQTDAEMLSAAPAFFIAHTAGTISYFVTGSKLAVPSLALVIVHVALYLPFPGNRVDTNPFYVTVRNKIRSFQRLLQSPIEGWGEDEG